VTTDRGRGSPALGVYLWTRAAMSLLAVSTAVLLADRANPARSRWDSPRLHELGVVVDVWARWDSDWFLRIASEGYAWPSGTPAFFPLYPLLTGGLGRLLLGHTLLAGVVVSVGAGAVAFALLHRLGEGLVGGAAARRAVVLLAVFPTSLFLGAVYSEALFLALAVSVFLLAERGRIGWSAVATGLALLTRGQGVALLLPLALYAWRRGGARGLWVLAVPLGIGATFPTLLALWVGQPLAFVDAQGGVWGRHVSALGPLGGVLEAVRAASLLDRHTIGLAVVAVMLALALLAWRRLGAAYGLYALVALLLPLSFPSDRLGGVYSFPRLCLVAFPCFLAAGTIQAPRAVRVGIVAVLSALLAVNVVRWSLWYWVA
jgi:Mannosyltransferase (PIG-V)